MKLVLGSDHRGYRLKFHLQKILSEMEIELLDVGTFSTDSVDYPDFGASAAEKISNGEYDRGILMCGSGIGMSIVANKFPRIRAALCHDVGTAKMSREHNDSNVLILGADFISQKLAGEILRVWLTTEFQGGRHNRRITKIRQLESRLNSLEK